MGPRVKKELERRRQQQLSFGAQGGQVRRFRFLSRNSYKKRKKRMKRMKRKKRKRRQRNWLDLNGKERTMM